MNIEQAINYLKSSGMSDEQIIEVADALTKGAISQLRAEIESLEDGIASYHNDRPWIFKDEVLEVFDKYAEMEADLNLAKDIYVPTKDVLDKIMKLQTYKMYEGENTVYVERDDVLQIIDKYAESEERDADSN